MVSQLDYSTELFMTWKAGLSRILCIPEKYRNSIEESMGQLLVKYVLIPGKHESVRKKLKFAPN